MSQSWNVLISSAGRRVALVQLFRQALADLGVPGRVLAADQSRMSAAFHAADAGFEIPPCSREDFVPTMVELCRTQAVRLVVPTIDTELAAYAAHRSDFAVVGTTVAVSTPEVVAIGSDKRATHNWLSGNGIATVRQTTPADARADPRGWPLPLVVKPRFGSASVGLSVVRTPAQFEAALEVAGELIVQDVAPGIEHTLDLLAGPDGRCRCVVPRRRLEVRGGEVSKSVTVRSEPLIELGRRLCDALPGAYGALNAQVFVDDGALRVIELNPRFGGGYPLSYQAGADFPRGIIEDLVERAPRDMSWRDGLVMLRYDDAVFLEPGE